ALIDMRVGAAHRRDTDELAHHFHECRGRGIHMRILNWLAVGCKHTACHKVYDGEPVAGATCLPHRAFGSWAGAGLLRAYPIGSRSPDGRSIPSGGVAPWLQAARLGRPYRDRLLMYNPKTGRNLAFNEGRHTMADPEAVPEPTIQSTDNQD